MPYVSHEKVDVGHGGKGLACASTLSSAVFRVWGWRHTKAKESGEVHPCDGRETFLFSTYLNIQVRIIPEKGNVNMPHSLCTYLQQES